jgi:hypothetical protein
MGLARRTGRLRHFCEIETATLRLVSRVLGEGHLLGTQPFARHGVEERRLVVFERPFQQPPRQILEIPAARPSVAEILQDLLQVVGPRMRTGSVAGERPWIHTEEV